MPTKPSKEICVIDSMLGQKHSEKTVFSRVLLLVFFFPSFGTNPRHIRKSDELINY